MKAAATEQEAFPNHNLSKVPSCAAKWSGLCSARSTASRSPSAVARSAGRTATPPGGTETALAEWKRRSKHSATFKESLNLFDRNRRAVLSRTAQQPRPVALLLRPHGFHNMFEDPSAQTQPQSLSR